MMHGVLWKRMEGKKGEEKTFFSFNEKGGIMILCSLFEESVLGYQYIACISVLFIVDPSRRNARLQRAHVRER